MPTVGRLKEGDFLISGEVNERVPVVKSGLMAHFPFDGTERGERHSPIMNYSIWEDGQVGAIGQFGTYSTASLNSRIIGSDPWGNPAVLWKSINPNAGIYHSAVPIDNTKTYRMSWWEKRVNNGSGVRGVYYAGLNGYGSVNGVMPLTSTTPNTNPYFWNSSGLPTQAQLPLGEWVLVVGHVFPHSHSGTTRHPDSGRYTVSGKLGDTNSDFKWLPETTTARSRTLTIYQGDDAAIEHHTIYPRMDICDGTEPTIEEMLRGESHAIKPSTNTHTSIDKEGIVIEESTTNLIGVGDQTFDWGGYLGATITRTENVYVSEWESARGVRIQASGGTSVIKMVKSFVTAPASGRFFSVQLKVKNIGKKDVIFSSNLGGVFATVKPGEAKLVSNNRVGGNGSTHLQIQIRSTAAEDSLDIIALEPQIEEKRFPTSFASTTRGNSSFYIDGLGGATNYTITGYFKLSQPFKNSGAYLDSPSNGAYLFRIHDRLLTGQISYRYYEDGTFSSPYLNRSGTYGSGNIHNRYELNTDDWVFFYAQKSGTSFKCRMYQGDWKAEHSTTVNSTARLDDLRFADSTILNMKLRDLSIYNRALSQEEIDRIRIAAMSLDKKGNLVSRVQEGGTHPANTIGYFSLGGEGAGNNTGIEPIEEINNFYEDGAVWIGESASNLHTSPVHGFATQAHMSVSDIVFINPIVREGTVRRFHHLLSENRTGDQRMVQEITPWVNKTDEFTYSAWVYIPAGHKHQARAAYWRVNQSADTNHWTGNNRVVRSKVHDPNLIGQWQRIWVTFKGDASDAGNNFYVCYYHQIEVGCDIYATGGQLEKTPYPTPFMEGTRGEGVLNFPYDTVNLLSDFTVMGWWKPGTVGDATYNPAITFNRRSSNYTNRRILIMESGTSTTQLQVWLSNGTSEQTVRVEPTRIAINEWNFFALRKSGAGVTLFHGVGSRLGTGSSSTGGTFLSSLNASIDSNWGWMIGRYHTGGANQGNAYHKDYVFTSSSLSDAEIEMAFRRNMKAEKSNQTKTRGQIKERRMF